MLQEFESVLNFAPIYKEPTLQDIYKLLYTFTFDMLSDTSHAVHFEQLFSYSQASLSHLYAILDELMHKIKNEFVHVHHYQELEYSLQKAEKSIRIHIQNKQQLALDVNNLREALDDKDAEMRDKMYALDSAHQQYQMQSLHLQVLHQRISLLTKDKRALIRKQQLRDLEKDMIQQYVLVNGNQNIRELQRETKKQNNYEEGRDLGRERQLPEDRKKRAMLREEATSYQEGIEDALKN